MPTANLTLFALILTNATLTQVSMKVAILTPAAQTLLVRMFASVTWAGNQRPTVRPKQSALTLMNVTPTLFCPLPALITAPVPTTTVVMNAYVTPDTRTWSLAILACALISMNATLEVLYATNTLLATT